MKISDTQQSRNMQQLGRHNTMYIKNLQWRYTYKKMVIHRTVG